MGKGITWGDVLKWIITVVIINFIAMVTMGTTDYGAGDFIGGAALGLILFHIIIDHKAKK